MAIAVGLSIPLTGDPLKDGLIQGGSWQFSGAQTLTYSLHSASFYDWSWTAARANAISDIFAAWSNVADISFQKVSTAADYTQSSADLAITFAGYDYYALAEAFFPDPAFANEVLPTIGENRTSYPKPEGDLSLYELSTSAFNYLDPGGFGFAIILHELGHALGLKHPHDDGATGRPLLASQYDNGYDTVMSYEDPQVYDFGSIIRYDVGFQATPMPLDILAIQHIYGANMTFHAGNDVYILSDNGIVSTIWDAGGIDEIDASGLTRGVTLSLAEGSLIRHGSYSATALAYNMVIEHATGTAYADRLTGNAADNILNGGAGADTLTGAGGDDTYYLDNSGDRVIEGLNGGADIVYANASHSLSANVEDLILTGIGNFYGYGNTLDNTLTGNAGSNSLNGGAGADTMAGGLGDDNYVVDNSGDVIIENPGEGSDKVVALASYILDADLEQLTLAGSASVNATGNDAVNILTGNSGNNILDGGLGADTMIGGSGNDIYIIDDAGDVATDSGGIDTLVMPFSHILASGWERMTLTGTADLDGTGNSAVNILTGNSGANRLDGMSGSDTMIGGDGDDTYVVGSTGDVVIELANEGTDTVISLVTYILRDHLDNLVLTGTNTVHGTGNALDNIITGNRAGNTLNGGAGADALEGGLGKDIYIVDNLGDTVTETSVLATEIDTVRSSVSFTLGANVENLLLTAAAAGTGNALRNTLTGSAGSDTLDGGAGADRMIGGKGNDTYYVDNILDTLTESSSGGIDTVYASVNKALGSYFERLVLEGGATVGTGNSLANVITGNANNDTLNGAGGNDTLDGGAGFDTLVGGSGADIFLFIPAGFDGTFDTINDFSRSQHDILDVADLLFGFDPLVSLIVDFVQLADSGLNTVFSVDRDGTGGGYAFVQVALVKNVTGLADEDALAASGQLVLT